MHQAVFNNKLAIIYVLEYTINLSFLDLPMSKYLCWSQAIWAGAKELSVSETE